MLNLKKFHDKQVKLVVVTLTIFLILVAVFMNDKPFEDYFGYVIIMWLFMSAYVIPYIEKKDMRGWMAALEYNENNLVPRRIIMIFAVFVCVLNFYLLLK